MKRVIEAEFETTAKKVSTAINRFFKKFPELESWREVFEYMNENGQSFESDEWFDKENGIRNNEWRWALHLNVNERYDSNDVDVYICVIERA